MTCTGGRTLFSMGLALLLLCAGCIARTARFTQSDASFRPQAGSTPPKVYIGREPDTSFTSVGIVEVRGPVTASKDDFLDEAVSKGTQLGCDVLVHKALYEIRSGSRAWGSSGSPAVRPTRSGVAAWLFTCGVADHGTPAQKAASDGVAKQIVQAEFGETVCSTEPITGTHLRKDVCWQTPAGVYPIWNNGNAWLPVTE